MQSASIARISLSACTNSATGAMVAAQAASSCATRYPRASVSVLGACRPVMSARLATSSVSIAVTLSGPAAGKSARIFAIKSSMRIGARAAVRAALIGAVRRSETSAAPVRRFCPFGWYGTITRSPRVISELFATTGKRASSSGQHSSRVVTAVSHSAAAPATAWCSVPQPTWECVPKEAVVTPANRPNGVARLSARSR